MNIYWITVYASHNGIVRKSMFTYTYVSGFEKRGNFAQKLVFYLSSLRNSALLKLHYALCLKLLAAYVSKKQVHESQAHVESHFQKLVSKDWLPSKIHWIPDTARTECKFLNALYKVITQNSILQTSPYVGRKLKLMMMQ